MSGKILKVFLIIFEQTALLRFIYQPWEGGPGAQCFLHAVLLTTKATAIKVTPLCNRPPGINLIRGTFSLGQGAKKELGGSKFIRGAWLFFGYSVIFALAKRIMWGQLRIIQVGTFEN